MASEHSHFGPVELLFQEYQALYESAQRNSPSDLSALNSVYTKSILIAAASNLEFRVKHLMEQCFRDISGNEAAEFVRRKVLDRGYHTLFAWDGKDARSFFSQFGDDAKARFFDYCSDEDHRQRQAAFITLGSERNQLVHNDYATYPISKTPRELIELYRRAGEFLEDLIPLALGNPTKELSEFV